VLVAGPKLAGKTTLLIHALLSGGAQYVSNDRVLLDLYRAPLHARGVPTIVTIRQGTLDRFPAFSTALAGASFHHRLTLDEAAAPAGREVHPSGNARGLSPAQLCWSLRVEPLGECEVGAVLFPWITNEPGGLAVRRLDEAEAATQLSGALFGLPPGGWTSDVFSVSSGPPTPDLVARVAGCRTLAARVPCFECRVGLSAFAPPGSAEELIASVLRPC
jgi:hypothetical protein